MNAHLHNAKIKKNDEFYTRYEDIKRECDHYLEQFSGKVIYCNCDCEKSAFRKYFLELYSRGIIKRLIVSGIDPADGSAYYLDTENPFGTLEYGYYNTPEALQLMAESDIIITNPPFSKYRDFMAYVLRSGKDFLIVSLLHIFKYYIFRKMLKEKRIRTGVYNSGFPFLLPDGRRLRLGCAFWITSLDVEKPGPEFVPAAALDLRPYEDYPEAVDVPGKNQIPGDYPGLVGLPLSAFAVLRPDQYVFYKVVSPRLDGRELFDRIICRIYPDGDAPDTAPEEPDQNEGGGLLSYV